MSAPLYQLLDSTLSTLSPLLSQLEAPPGPFPRAALIKTLLDGFLKPTETAIISCVNLLEWDESDIRSTILKVVREAPELVRRVVRVIKDASKKKAIDTDDGVLKLRDWVKAIKTAVELKIREQDRQQRTDLEEDKPEKKEGEGEEHHASDSESEAVAAAARGRGGGGSDTDDVNSSAPSSSTRARRRRRSTSTTTLEEQPAPKKHHPFASGSGSSSRSTGKRSTPRKQAPSPKKAAVAQRYPVGSAVYAYFGEEWGWWPALVLNPVSQGEWWRTEIVGRHTVNPYLVKCIPLGGDFQWTAASKVKPLAAVPTFPTGTSVQQSDRDLYTLGLEYARDRSHLDEWTALETDTEKDLREALEREG